MVLGARLFPELTSEPHFWIPGNRREGWQMGWKPRDWGAQCVKCLSRQRSTSMLRTFVHTGCSAWAVLSQFFTREGIYSSKTQSKGHTSLHWGLPKWLSGKEFACQSGDLHSIPGSGRCPREGNGNPFHYSCLGNLMDRGARQASPQGITRVGYNLLTKLPLRPIPLR